MDGGILVISSPDGPMAQTREHILLSKQATGSRFRVRLSPRLPHPGFMSVSFLRAACFGWSERTPRAKQLFWGSSFCLDFVGLWEDRSSEFGLHVG